MTKIQFGRIFSVLISAVMLAAVLPTAASAALAGVDLTEPLGKFTQEQLEATYTSENKFLGKDGFVAPAFYSGAEAKLSTDSKKSGTLRLIPKNAETKITSEVGFAEALSLGAAGSGAESDSFTVKMSIKRPEISKSVYFYLSDGRSSTRWQMMRLWGSSICINNQNTGLSIEADTWYDFTIAVDMTNKIVMLKVDGGEYDNACAVSNNSASNASYQISETQIYNSFMIGWIQATVSPSDYFEIGDVAIDTTAEIAGLSNDASLTFENGTLGTHASGQWTNGSWDVQESVFLSSKDNKSVVDAGDAHGSVLKLTGDMDDEFCIGYSLSGGEEGSCGIGRGAATGVLVMEASYKDGGEKAGQLRMQVTGEKADGTEQSFYPISGADAQGKEIKFCGNSSQTVQMLTADSWVRVRIELDLENDKVTMSQWRLNSPDSVTKLTDTEVLAGYESITKVSFNPFVKYSSSELYLDDFRVYEKTALRIDNTVPVDNADGIEKSVAPQIVFNMPIKSVGGLSANLELDEEKVQAELEVDGSGRAVVVKPKELLEPEKTYILKISGTVTDIFNQSIAVDRTIEFSTEDMVKVISCRFYQNEKETNILEAGELTAKLSIVTDGEARDMLVLLCLYEEGKSLLKAKAMQSVKTASKELELTLSVPDDGKAHSAKIFIWDTPGALKPYTTPIGGNNSMELVNYNEARVEEQEKVKVTDEQVTERMADKILMTTESTRALVDNEVVPLDSSNAEFTAEVIDGTPMVPLGFIAESLGATVSNTSSGLKVTAGGRESIINKEETAFTIDGSEYTLKVAATEKDGHLLVPLEAVRDILQEDVFYDSCGYIIIGDGAEDFDPSATVDKKLLDKAVRNVLFDTVTGDEIIGALTSKHPDNAHPRLMITKASLPELRNKVKTDIKCQKWMSDLLKLCEEYLAADPLPYGRLDGIRMLVTSRKACDYIWNLSFAYLMTEDEKYAEGAREVLLNVCGDNFPDWNPYHWLDVAEMTAAVGLGYDWCYDYLSDDDKKIIINGITEKGLKPGLDELNLKEGLVHSSGYWANPNNKIYPSNWVSVCSGSLIMGSLAVADESVELKALTGDILAKCLEKEKDMVAAFSPDGAWKEGPTYWRYAYKYLSFALDSLKTALGTDYGLTKSPGLHHGAYFMIGMTASVANFDLANSDYKALDCPQLMWLSKCYEDKALTCYRTWFLEEYGYKAGFNDIIWYVPEYAGELGSIPTETNTRISPIATTRTGYGKEEFYVGFHGADDGGGRVVDMDAGTYIIDLFGKRWIIDSGTESHTYHSYEGVKLRDYYRMRAEGHNTIVVNPGYYEDQNYYALKDIERYEYNDRYTLMASDFTNVYEFKGVKSFKRAITADKATLTTKVQDEIKFVAPSELYSFVHLGGTAEIAPDGRSAVLTQDNYKMGVQLIGNSSLRLEKMNAVPLETSPDTLALGAGTDDSARWKLYIHAENIISAKYALIFTPLCGSETAAVAAGELEDFNALALPASDSLPKLKKLLVNGAEIAAFSSDKRIYSLTYKGDIKEAVISAEGDGEISIEPPTDENRCGRVTVTKDGKSNHYFLAFN